MKLSFSDARVFLEDGVQWAFSGPVTIFDGWVRVEAGALSAATDEKETIPAEMRGEEEMDQAILFPAHRISSVEEN